MDSTIQALMQTCREDGLRWFPHSQTPENLTLCLAGEVGEIANIMKKVVRGDFTIFDAVLDEGLAEEVVDALIYLLSLMGHPDFQGVNWQHIWDRKRKFNEERFGTPPMDEADYHYEKGRTQ